MNKFLLLPFILTLILQTVAMPAFCDDIATDEWSDIGKMQDAWDGQKIITDDMVNKIIEQRTKKDRQKQEKRFKRKVGEAINPNAYEETNVKAIKKIAEDYPTLLVPKTLLFDEVQIPPGFYRILAAKNKQGAYSINFYQGNSLVGKIPALQTEDDFESETINYAKIIYAERDNRAKIVYGCLDYNLVAETGTK